MRLGTDGADRPEMTSAAFADIVFKGIRQGILKGVQRGHVNVPSSAQSKHFLQNKRYQRAQMMSPVTTASRTQTQEARNTIKDFTRRLTWVPLCHDSQLISERGSPRCSGFLGAIWRACRPCVASLAIWQRRLHRNRSGVLFDDRTHSAARTSSARKDGSSRRFIAGRKSRNAALRGNGKEIASKSKMENTPLRVLGS